MGTWGDGIYDDDVAQDARDAYQELLSTGLDGSAATDRFLKDWKVPLKDEDDGPVIWFALAATQWKLGRLEDRVRDTAVRLIDDDSSLDRWREAGEKVLAKRKKVLAELKKKLQSPQPPAKKIKVDKPVQPVAKGQVLKPSELRRQLKAIHCSVEPKRGKEISDIACRGGMTDELLLAIVAGVPSLQSLHIDNCPKLSRAALASIGRLGQLRQLALKDLPLCDADLANWRDLTLLERLTLHGAGITDEGLEHFAKCRHLHTIDLSRTSVGNKSLAWAGNFPRIRVAWLRGTKVTDEGLGQFEKLAQLSHLFLSRTAISDRAASKLARMSKLLWLDLEGTRITDQIASSLAKMSSLGALDIANTALTDKSVPAIRSMTQLCYLNLNQTKISQAGQRQLTESLPLLGNQEAINRLYDALSG